MLQFFLSEVTIMCPYIYIHIHKYTPTYLSTNTPTYVRVPTHTCIYLIYKTHTVAYYWFS